LLRGDRLATIYTGRKVGDAVPLSVGALIKMPLRTEVGLRTEWHPDQSSRLATIATGRRRGAAVPLLDGPFHIFRPVYIVAKRSPISATAELLLRFFLVSLSFLQHSCSPMRACDVPLDVGITKNCLHMNIILF